MRICKMQENRKMNDYQTPKNQHVKFKSLYTTNFMVDGKHTLRNDENWYRFSDTIIALESKHCTFSAFEDDVCIVKSLELLYRRECIKYIEFSDKRYHLGCVINLINILFQSFAR